MKKEHIIFIVIIFMSMLFEFVGFFNVVRAKGEKYIAPILALDVSLMEKMIQPYNMIVFSFFRSEYLKQLESQHAQVLAQLNELDALRAENAELRDLLGASNRELKTNTIVGVPILSLAFPAVGVGLEDGVEVNDMVLIDQVLVGTIDSVSEYQSRVSLLTSPRKSRILAQTESGAQGVITGDGRNVLLTHIPRSTEVKEGERVVTVGQEGIEKNILIGTVQKTQQNASDATQTLVISQLVSFYNAVIVEVK